MKGGNRGKRCRKGRVSVMRCLILALLLIAPSVGCKATRASIEIKANSQQEQDLPITYGGFLQDGPENEVLDGVCAPGDDRSVLVCDVHNGFVQWTLTEITFKVVNNFAREDEPQHLYRERLVLASLQSAHIVLRLGMMLPPDTYLRDRHGTPVSDRMSHWGWLIIGAKGRKN
jgi:hypothetical protein